MLTSSFPPRRATVETLAYVLARFQDVNFFFFLHMLFKEQIAMDRIVFSSLSFPCKYMIDQRRFHAKILSNQWYIARIFQIWSTTAGRKWLTGDFSLRNGEIIWLTDNRPFSRWRHLTTTTRIHFVFALLLKFVNPAED